MIGKKGISPLIASVILIAFVIAVAAIAGNFFTGFTEKQKVTVETKGGTLIDCSVTRMEIDPDTINTAASGLNFIASNLGEEDISNIKIVVFDNASSIDTVTASPSTLSKSTSIKIENGSAFSSVDPAFAYYIKLTTTDCPGVDSQANCSTWGATGCTKWKLVG